MEALERHRMRDIEFQEYSKGLKAFCAKITETMDRFEDWSARHSENQRTAKTGYLATSFCPMNLERTFQSNGLLNRETNQNFNEVLQKFSSTLTVNPNEEENLLSLSKDLI